MSEHRGVQVKNKDNVNDEEILPVFGSSDLSQ